MLGRAGLLAVDDAVLAADHYVLLAATEISNRTAYGRVALEPDETRRLATAGVRAFLHGYSGRE